MRSAPDGRRPLECAPFYFSDGLTTEVEVTFDLSALGKRKPHLSSPLY